MTYLGNIPDECLLQVSTHVHNVVFAVDKAGVTEEVLRKHRVALADRIVRDRVSTREHDYSIEFTTSVVVLNPDDFWRIVQTEAIRLSSRMNRQSLT